MKEPTKLLIVLVAGCLFGVFVFLPMDELTSYCDYHFKEDWVRKLLQADSAWRFVTQQMIEALLLRSPVKLVVYLVLGGIMGSVSYLLMSLLERRNALILQLEHELSKDLAPSFVAARTTTWNSSLPSATTIVCKRSARLWRR